MANTWNACTSSAPACAGPMPNARCAPESNNERLEPEDSTIAALQQKVCELRAMRNVAGLGRDVSHLSSATSEGQLQAAAFGLMMYEDLKAAGR